MYFKKWKDFIILEDNIVNTKVEALGGTNGVKITNDKTVKNGSNGTNGSSSETNISTADEKELQKLLNKWNDTYSQSFKFGNDMPKTVNNENNVEELITNIQDEYKVSVKEGIAKLVEFFKNPKIADSFNGKEIVITGYTSGTASDAYNQTLSEKRAKIVANAIKDMLKQNKLNLNIKFVEKGEGEKDSGSLILNDETLEPVQFGVLGKNLANDKNLLTKLENSKEERQKLNRRVVLSLPNYTYTPTIIPTKYEKNIPDKPKTPTPTDITFNWDSFILTQQGESIIKSFCTELKKYNESSEISDDKKIKNIYISTHTRLGKDDKFNNEEDKKTQEHALSILASNRGQFVRDYMRLILGENTIKNINFFVYPVAFTMGTEEKKVVITYEKTEHMKTAEQKFSELASKYNIPNNENGLENLPVYLDNEPLLEKIINNIKVYIEKSIDRKNIPLELAYDNLSGYYGFKKYIDFRKKSQEKIKNIIDKTNRKQNKNYTFQDFVYDAE